MNDPLKATLGISASGLSAQAARLKVVSENLANAQSTSTTPGGDPYQRKTVSFSQALDQASGVDLVKISDVGFDKSPFIVSHDPSHPAADEKGMVRLPNVNTLVEMSDMREASRSYEANLQVIKRARQMISQTIDLLRSSS